MKASRGLSSLRGTTLFFVRNNCALSTVSQPVWNSNCTLSAFTRTYVRFAKSPYDTDLHGTTILCVRKDNQVVMIGDGQVTQGSTVVKPNARKVRRIRPGIVAGFAGATADAFTLFERLDEKLDEHQGQLLRACVALAKNWRTDKYLRRLEAVMIVADRDLALTITGNGDVIEPADGLIAVGSGGDFALACARGLIDQPLDAETIAKKSMDIAAEMCIYTNKNYVIEKIPDDASKLLTSPAGGNILSVDMPQEKKEEKSEEPK